MKKTLTNSLARKVILISIVVLLISIFANVYLLNEKRIGVDEKRERFCGDQNMCSMPGDM